MKPFNIAVFFALYACTSTIAQTNETGSSIKGKDSGLSLRATMAMTLDEIALRRAWEEAKESPKLEVTHNVSFNSPVSTVIVFQNCVVDAYGKCNVSVIFSLVDPAGKTRTLPPTQLWSSAPIPNKLMLGASSITLKFNKPDEAGVYNVQAKLIDNISGRVFATSTNLTVSE